MLKLQVVCHKGDEEFCKDTPEEMQAFIEKIESGEIETFQKGRYYIYDKNLNRIVAKAELQDGQELVMVPVIAGG